MLKIRRATKADTQKLLAIYTPYVSETTITFEYEIPTLEDFQNRITTTLEKYPYLVAEETDGTLLGYAYAHAYKERTAYDWTVEVSIYVDSLKKGQGAGKKLYAALEAALKEQNILHLTACITAGNKSSVSFHEKFEYREVGLFKEIGYKFNKWHDVLWMQKELQQTAAPKPFIPFSAISAERLASLDIY